MNREQRRASKKLMNHPEMKVQVNNFASELAQFFVDAVEKSKEHSEKTGEEFKMDFNKEFQEMMIEKGRQFGKQALSKFKINSR